MNLKTEQPDNLTDEQYELYKIFRDHPEMTTAQIERRVKYTPNTVRKYRSKWGFAPPKPKPEDTRSRDKAIFKRIKSGESKESVSRDTGLKVNSIDCIVSRWREDNYDDDLYTKLITHLWNREFLR